MHWLEFYNIAERFQDLINPTSDEKVIKIGEKLGLNDKTSIIDFGSGCGWPLTLWAKKFGIHAIGLEFRKRSYNRALELAKQHGVEKNIEYILGDASQYEFKPNSFDVASCMGASFIWNGFRPSLQALKKAIKPNGKILIGEPYWVTDNVPPAYAIKEKFYSELDLLRVVHEEGLDMAFMVRASADEWDRYETANWEGLISWIQENPDHPERHEVVDKLHEWQDEYFRYGRQYLGWAMYILIPKL
ncbi:MAG: class I SAM-dependent methyltransferase [Candidatus Zixiibacteriota bacterium]